jgi:outer membrane receptor for ferrienterochelin and colicins
MTGRTTCFLYRERWIVCLGIVGALLVAAASRGDEISAKPVAELAEMDLSALMEIEIPTVVGASKHEQKTTEAPASVTIVTADDIKKFGYRTLGDIVRSVPGFYTAYDRSYGYMGVRGFNRPGDYGGRILLLVNGHRMNDAIYDTAPPANDFILDVDLIDRVEFIRGPGSSLYGTNAFFGVINVITRKGREYDGAETSGSVGSQDTYRGRFSYGKQFRSGVELVLSGTIEDSRGEKELYVPEYDDPLTNNGIARRLDDGQLYSVFGSLSWKGVTLDTGYIERYKQVPNGLYETAFGDPQHEYIDRRGFVEGRYQLELDNGGELLVRGYFDWYTFDGDYPYDYADPGDPPDIVVNRDEQRAQATGVELRIQQTFLERHRMTAGVEFHFDYELDLNNYDVRPQFSYQDVNAHSYRMAVYAQDEFKFADKWLLNAGVRFDYYENFGETINPRVALIWQPRQTTTLKAIGGTAFRAPNAYERLYVTDTNVANVDLEPETITSIEMIWEQSVGKHVRTSVSGFYNDIDDLINQASANNGSEIYVNSGGARAYGVELELQAQLQNGWRGRASYTFTETEDSDTGARLDNGPQHLAKLNIVAPLYRDKVFAGVELQYTSSRDAPSGDEIGDFVLVNLTLFAHRFWSSWEVSASVYNVFDTEYDDPTDTVPALVRSDGRQWRIKCTYRF